MADPDDFREPHLRHGDFLGAFGVLRRGPRVLLCQNRRSIHGREQLTWDLPGGQVEPGELLHEALARELEEELGIGLIGEAPFLFVQEGERFRGSERLHAWRSFFFACREWRGEPLPCGEILDVRWMDPDEVTAVLGAPYHDSFRRWLWEQGRFYRSVWRDPV